MWLFWRTWPLTQWGEMLCWWANVSAEMPLHSFSVWARWECFGSSWGEDFVPRKNGLSPAFVVLEEGSFKAGGGVLPVLPSYFLPRGKAEEAQACCVFFVRVWTCVQYLLPLVCNMPKMFSSPSLCLQWLLLTISSVFSSPLSALALAAFLHWLVQIWL